MDRRSTKRLAAAAGLALAVAAVVLWRAMSAPPPPAVEAPPVSGAPAAVADAASPAARTAARPAPRFSAEQIAQLNEAVLMARLREIAASDPAAAVELARAGNSRFPDSAAAPERESILIHALSALDLPSEARGEAERMVSHYPDSDWVRDIEAFTGAHRHRNLRLDDAGRLITE